MDRRSITVREPRAGMDLISRKSGILENGGPTRQNQASTFRQSDTSNPVDSGENERKRLWDKYQAELQQTAADLAAETKAEPVVFLSDVRDSMARKIADYFIDEEQAKQLLTRYRKKREPSA